MHQREVSEPIGLDLRRDLPRGLPPRGHRLELQMQGFRVIRFKVWGLGLRFRVSGLGFRVSGLGFRV